MTIFFRSKVKILHTFLISLAMLLAACGGGGGGDSSSGGGSESIYAGTYTGTENWTISSPTVPSESGVDSLTVVVASNGDVIITDSDTQSTGSLTGESLSATGTLEEITVPGANCPATTITYTGTVSGTTITGSLSGAYNCTLSTGGTFKVTISGSFTVTRQPETSATALGFNGNKRAILENYVRDIVSR